MNGFVRKFITYLPVLWLLVHLFTCRELNSRIAQPPAGATLDPVNNQSCSQSGCHSTFPPFFATRAAATIGTTQANQAALDGFRYTPGTQYIIIFTATGNSSRLGFQMSALTASNANAGAFAVTDAVNTSLASLNGISYIGHHNASGIRTWSFKWTAPASDVGNITFYSAVNQSNGNNSASGDSIFHKLFVVRPPFSVNAGNDVTICSGGSAQLQATPLNASGTVTYSWSPASGLSCTACSNPMASPSVTTTYSVTAANSGQTAADAITVNVTPSVTPSVTISATATTICAGTPVTFTATPINGGAAPAYQWKKNGNNAGTNSATYSDNALADGSVITCVLTSNAACASPATVTSNVISITVPDCDDGMLCTADLCNNATCTNTDTCCFRQNIGLNTGWNMISGYVIPDEAGMSDVFSAISSSIVLVKNNAGQTYIPSFNINTIGNWDYRQGYKVKTSGSVTLTLGCSKAAATTPLPLAAGWNIIAYLRTTPMSISAALSSLGPDIILVKNNAGQTYIPNFGINTIGSMLPGQGYQIKMAAPATLVYPPE